MWWCTVSVLFCLALAFFAKIAANKLVTSILVMSHINEFIGNFVSAVFVMELGILACTAKNRLPSLLHSWFT